MLSDGNSGGRGCMGWFPCVSSLHRQRSFDASYISVQRYHVKKLLELAGAMPRAEVQGQSGAQPLTHLTTFIPPAPHSEKSLRSEERKGILRDR